MKVGLCSVRRKMLNQTNNVTEIERYSVYGRGKVAGGVSVRL